MKFKPDERTGGVAIELRRTEQQLPVEPSAPAATALEIFNLKKILVPVDFSESSNKALTYATAMAKQFSAEITLIHVAQIYPAVPDMGLPLNGNYEAVHYGLKEMEVLRLTVGNAAPVETVLRTGVPWLEITRAAKELKSDLIVLSTRGHRGITRMLLGSTTEHVVREAPCPVLVVRQKEHEFLKPQILHEN